MMQSGGVGSKYLFSFYFTKNVLMLDDNNDCVMLQINVVKGRNT